MSRTLTSTLAWAGDGAAHLRGLMMRMADAAFTAPSLLPGWTRAHVLSHVARNADAMINLLESARTGVPTPAYASREQRDHDIELGAARDPTAIRADVLASSDRLAAAVRGMPAAAWSAPVGGDEHARTAADVPWLRAREMWIHSVDLDVGASLGDAPPPMLIELLTDASGTIGARARCPTLTLVAVDLDRSWALGVVGADDSSGAVEPVDAPPVQRVEVRGTAAGLALWLMGRSKGRDLRTGNGSPLPVPPRWL